jgi:hypothetical protein
MVNEENVIKFYPWDKNVENVTLPPVPAYKYISQEWRDLPRFVNSTETSEGMLTVKHCMPFFDAMTAGYYYLLPCDITITATDGVPKASWDFPIKPITERSHLEIPTPEGYYQAHFSWQMWWGMKVPEGWSILITSPLNHNEVPFRTTSGIVDYDRYTSPGNIGFFILKGFEGVIKKGTPIFQIIPVKRADWTMEIDRSLQEQGHKDHDAKLSSPRGHYKKHIRVDKKYR